MIDCGKVAILCGTGLWKQGKAGKKKLFDKQRDLT